jgi:protein-L-isoaspartate(D-aspartate) O-methyltransferase
MSAVVTTCLVAAALMACLWLSCACQGEERRMEEADWVAERSDMVAVLRRYGIRDERILTAMNKVRRHRFIPAPFRERSSAYGDHPCPIGHGQTISQPYIVAYMTEKLALKSGEKVLEIGTGSGYQAAVLAELGAKVYTIEILAPLAEHARKALADEGCGAVQVRTGDGYKGWPEQAPFDAVIVTCAPDDVPQALVDQLKEGGRMIIPVGAWGQRLVLLRKTRGKVEKFDDLPVRFVPMVKGGAGDTGKDSP